MTRFVSEILMRCYKIDFIFFDVILPILDNPNINDDLPPSYDTIEIVNR